MRSAKPRIRAIYSKNQKCFSFDSFSLFLFLFRECSKTKYSIKYSDKRKLHSNSSFILQANNRFPLQAIAKYEIPLNSLVNLLMLTFSPCFLQSLGNREPTLFGLGQLKEFLDVTPIVLQMFWASHRCSVNRAQKMLHWCTFAPVLSARRCSLNVPLI